MPWIAAALCVACLGFAQVTEKAQRDAQSDVKLGREYIAELEKGLTFSKDEAAVARVQRIGKELADIANTHQVKAIYGDGRLFNFDYSFKLIEENDVNAFSVPGGFIYVYSGLLDFVESDDELAAVLAHEIAHASHRHMATLLRERSKIELATLPIVLAALLGNARDAGALIITQDLLKTALTNSWSQDAERDADQAGFYYMTHTKYNPAAMLTFLERLAFKEANSPKYDWGIERTHPASAARVRSLLLLLQSNQIPIERSKVTTSFRTMVKASNEGSELLFGSRSLFTLRGPDAEVRASAAAERLNRFFDYRPHILEARSSENKVFGRGQLLIEMTEADGGAQAAASALQAIKNALFSLSLRTAG